MKLADKQTPSPDKRPESARKAFIALLSGRKLKRLSVPDIHRRLIHQSIPEFFLQRPI